MGADSKIEWCDHTINFWIGCTKVSAACDHCYAQAQAARFGLAKWGHGEPRAKTKSAIATAFRLDRKAAKAGRRAKVFANSMSDFFDAEVPDEWRDEAMAVMALTPHLDWLVLTKRPKVMRAYLAGLEPGGARNLAIRAATIHHLSFCADSSRPYSFPLPNVWLGTTVEDQKMADLRIPELRATPAAKRILSVEPMLGAIDLRQYLVGHCIGWTPPLDWIICGGESGPHARSMHPQWARDLRDQCQAAGVPFFFKQWGEWEPSTPERANGNPRSGWRALSGRSPAMRAELYPEAGAAFVERVGKARAGRLLDGREWNEFPA